MDRRTLMQVSGVAGAGALGLGAVTADPASEHYVIASDTHLGSPFANDADFQAFLTTEVPAIDPDTLVMAGDCFEMWFRGMSSALLEYSSVADQFQTLEQNGTDVTLVAGNHDRRLVSVGEGLDDPPGSPWEIGEEFFFQSGGTEFVAVHGDGPDPIQVDPVSETLCRQTDLIGSVLAALVGWWDGLEPWAHAAETGSVTVTDGSRRVPLEGSYDDPVVVTAGSADGPVTAGRVGADSVELRAPAADADVGYAVFESGRHVLGSSTAVEAGRTVASGGWQTVSFAEPFDSTPVVLADVQTAGRTRAGRDIRFGRLPRRSDTPALRVRNVTELGFEVRVRGTAEVGFAAVEPGDISVRGRHGVADVGAVTPDSPSFGRVFAETPTLFSNAGVVSDPGSTGYVALTGDGPLYVSASTALSTPDAEAMLRSEWEQRVDAAGIDPDAVPEQPPGMAGLEPTSADDGSIRETLLDTYEEFVIYGHTHMPGLGERYANSGSWTGRSPDSEPENTFIEIQDGAVTVWDWSPDGKSVLYES